MTYIVRHTPTNRCFSISQSRSGYGYGDFFYNQIELDGEVRQVTRTVVAWERI